MKPDSNPPGAIFNFHFLPMWLYPDVWDENKEIKLRGLWFIALYVLSTLAFGGLIFVPLGFYLNNWTVTATVWLALGIGWGFLLGLAAWWDFTRRVKKLESLKKE